ncbi:MAG: hypothetical protein [Microviridae sp.]|nr:MAG: hypothetical protein [Microviridae sp.]
MATRFRTRLSSVPCAGEFQIDRTILTVPDQTISMREMLARSANGIVPVQSNRVPVYNENWIIPDLDTLDLNEIQDLKVSYEVEISQKEQFLKDAKQKYKDLQNQPAQKEPGQTDTMPQPSEPTV